MKKERKIMKNILKRTILILHYIHFFQQLLEVVKITKQRCLEKDFLGTGSPNRGPEFDGYCSTQVQVI